MLSPDVPFPKPLMVDGAPRVVEVCSPSIRPKACCEASQFFLCQAPDVIESLNEDHRKFLEAAKIEPEGRLSRCSNVNKFVVYFTYWPDVPL
eukprot:scaffold148266_cov39-Tisochrysis_lutea.AAC.1